MGETGVRVRKGRASDNRTKYFALNRHQLPRYDISMPTITAIQSGGAALVLKGHPATVIITKALDSASVDYKATLSAILKFSSHERQALEDKTITPAELNVPKPDGYTDERHADLCASFAASIKSDRQIRWNRGVAVGGVVVGLVGVVIAWFK